MGITLGQQIRIQHNQPQHEEEHSLGSIYVQPDSDCELEVQKHWFFELGKNEDFTLCEDDDIIARIDPPVYVAPENVEAETDADRPHTKKDDSNSSISGIRQVDAKDLCKLKSLDWMTDILSFKTDNPSHCTTMVSTFSIPYTY